MQIVTSILLFLLAVVVSAFIARLLPIRVPLPLLQIAIGAAISWYGFGVTLDSHLFLLLFIPPLLFLDGWRIPKGALFTDWRPVLGLAIGLVVFTVIGLGLFIDWLIPAMPLAVAFGLAAILSPTDPVAVTAMTASTPPPSRLMHILEGESLLNDATGLVCFSFAVTAALTGKFSLAEASVSFVLVAGGGVVAGLAVTWAVGWLNRLLVRRTGEEPGIQILISLLIPFAAYLVAEHVHVSGILAAAVAGIAMHYGELSGRRMAATRMQRTAVWDTVQLALNGIIFVLLGEQLPAMLSRLPEVAASSEIGSAWHLVAYVVAITITLGTLRYLWARYTLRMTVFRRSDGVALDPKQEFLLLAVTSAAGVRGAITLAGILTLPLLMPDGTPFPARDTAIFLAMGVILLSLLLASVALPLLMRGLTTDLPHASYNTKEKSARIAATEAAIRRIEALLTIPGATPEGASLRAEAGAHVLDVYRRRLVYGDPSGETAEDIRRLADAAHSLRMQALDAERDELLRLRRAHNIDDNVHRKLLREVDLRETSLRQEYEG